MRVWSGMLAVASALAFSGGALAQYDEEQGRDGPYVGAFGGVNFAPNFDLQSEVDAFQAIDDKNIGYVAGLMVGQQIGDFRIELEVARRENNLNQLAIFGVSDIFGPPAFGNFTTDGDVIVHSVMANLLYAPSWIDLFGFQPVVGAGFGPGIVDYDDIALNLPNGDIDLIDDGDIGIAAQGIAALERPITEHFRVQAGYRYFRVFDTQIALESGNPVDTAYDSHAIFLAAQYHFGRTGAAERAEPEVQELQPAQQPAPNEAPIAGGDTASVTAGEEVRIDVLANDRDPEGGRLRIVSVEDPSVGQVRIAPDGALIYQAPADYSGSVRFSYTVEDAFGAQSQGQVRVQVNAAAVPGPFLVFFNFDSAEITPDARRVIEQAAEAFDQFGLAEIEAVGHTDTSGPAWYNQRLAERRAASVRSALQAAGVPSNSIETAGRGESDPLVPTGDGVREPQNRRVEIFLSR